MALLLPSGDAHRSVHPEALAWIDGHACQGINAHHWEILLPSRWCDGTAHAPALHGWVGTGDAPLLMGQPEIVQIHQPTRDFLAAVRVALEVAGELDDRDPVRIQLLNALKELQFAGGRRGGAMH